MKIVVITGCLGLIGSYVTRQCIQKGWMVYGIDKFTYAANEESCNEFIQYENFEFVKEDIATLTYLPDSTHSLGQKTLRSLKKTLQTLVIFQIVIMLLILQQSLMWGIA